jgi:RNA polymerase sigma factor (sigma-70 family)
MEVDSWAGLIDRLHTRAARMLAAYGIPAQEADDLVQDALLALLSQPVEVRSVESSLAGILRHGCAAHIRQRYRERHVVQADPAALETLAAAASTRSACTDDRLDLVTLLDTLPVRQSCVLLLRFLGFSHEEIAAACRRSAPAVRRSSMRAIAKLHDRR